MNGAAMTHRRYAFARTRFVIAALLLGWVAACSSTDEAAPPASRCNDNADCPFATPICTDGTCRAAVGCQTDDDCSNGQKCLANGSCKTAECESDADCCTGGGACAQSCEDFNCVGSECTSGQSEGCFDGCHLGQRTCVSGVWQPCDAAKLTAAEVCDDNIDNDCNGKTDDGCAECEPGQKEACSGPCGEGEQVCGTDGLWGECSAPDDCTCEQGETFAQPCGNCGEKSAQCGPSGTWIFSMLCTGEGACEPAKTDTKSCGKCGTQVRICSVECGWEEWSKCGGEGPCTPGETEKQACGNCGEQTRTCGDDCQWGEWGDCEAGQGCQQGETQTKSCGLCGEQVSTCDSMCGWSPYGSCQNEGVCQPNAQQTEPCGNCGSRSRICGAGCQWGDWTECFGSGECEAGTQEQGPCGPSTDEGLCEFGTQIRTCSGTCSWNSWGSCLGATYEQTEICGNGKDEDCDGKDLTQPDDYEPNNTCGSCKHLGTDPNTFETGAIYGSFDTADDEFDYFCLTAHDGNSVPGFDEHIKVELTNQLGGIDADIHLYKGLANCQAGQTMALDKSVTIGGGDESIDWAGSTGTEDGGEYYIEVRNYEASGCSTSYKLHINGFN